MVQTFFKNTFKNNCVDFVQDIWKEVGFKGDFMDEMHEIGYIGSYANYYAIAKYSSEKIPSIMAESFEEARSELQESIKEAQRTSQERFEKETIMVTTNGDVIDVSKKEKD